MSRRWPGATPAKPRCSRCKHFRVDTQHVTTLCRRCWEDDEFVRQQLEAEAAARCRPVAPPPRAPKSVVIDGRGYEIVWP